MPAIDTLLIDRSPGETRVAALSDERVIEIHFHHAGDLNAEAIYAGRIGKILPDASAVFVDIGHLIPAFMNCGSKPPPEGSLVRVRIIQPPRGAKGAKVAQTEESGGTDPDKPGLVTPAPHPVGWCMAHYGETIRRVIVSPNDTDGLVKGLLRNDVPVTPWNKGEDLFARHGVDDAIEQALDPSVPIPGGGSLIVEHTAALTAVDIDAGPLPAAKANLAALDVIAQQIRLRAIAGPVIIDLIPSKDRAACVEKMKNLVADDPVPTRIAGLTPEGRMELNRRRMRPSLSDLLLDPVSVRDPTLDAVAYDALRRCVREGLAAKSARVLLEVHEDVAALLQIRLRPALDDARSVLKSEIELKGKSGVPRSHLDVRG